jgi:hypothetical protein
MGQSFTLLRRLDSKSPPFPLNQELATTRSADKISRLTLVKRLFVRAPLNGTPDLASKIS